RVLSPLMDSLDVAPTERALDIPTSGGVDSIALPTASELLVDACSRDSTRHGEGMLLGTVRDVHRGSLEQAAVTVTWQGEFTSASNQLTGKEHTLGILTDR